MIRAVYGTYSGHGMAKDVYPGRTEEEVRWGPHTGIPIIAPAAGRVEVYHFGTPLETLGGDYRVNQIALFDGWTCIAPDDVRAQDVTPQQTMHVVTWYPDEPFAVEGQRVGHCHYAHVARR